MFTRIVTNLRAHQLRSPILVVAVVVALLCSVAFGALLLCMFLVGMLNGDLTGIPFIPVVLVLGIAVIALIALSRALLRSGESASDNRS